MDTRDGHSARSRGLGRGSSESGGRGVFERGDNPQENSAGHRYDVCYNCGMPGHLISIFRKRIVDYSRGIYKSRRGQGGTYNRRRG